MIRSRSLVRNLVNGKRVNMPKRNVPAKTRILKEVRTALTTPIWGNTSGFFTKKGSPCFHRMDLGLIMECVQFGITKAFKVSKK